MSDSDVASVRSRSSDTTDSSAWEVEKVVGKKYEDGQWFYRMKWRNYPSSENTWEPLRNLNCDKLISEFEEQRRRAEDRREASEAEKDASFFVDDIKRVKRRRRTKESNRTATQSSTKEKRKTLAEVVKEKVEERQKRRTEKRKKATIGKKLLDLSVKKKIGEKVSRKRDLRIGGPNSVSSRSEFSESDSDVGILDKYKKAETSDSSESDGTDEIVESLKILSQPPVANSVPDLKKQCFGSDANLSSCESTSTIDMDAERILQAKYEAKKARNEKREKQRELDKTKQNWAKRSKTKSLRSKESTKETQVNRKNSLISEDSDEDVATQVTKGSEHRNKNFSRISMMSEESGEDNVTEIPSTSQTRMYDKYVEPFKTKAVKNNIQIDQRNGKLRKEQTRKYRPGPKSKTRTPFLKDKTNGKKAQDDLMSEESNDGSVEYAKPGVLITIKNEDDGIKKNTKPSMIPEGIPSKKDSDEDDDELANIMAELGQAEPKSAPTATNTSKTRCSPVCDSDDEEPPPKSSKAQEIKRPPWFRFQLDSSLEPEKIIGIHDGPYELIFEVKYKNHSYAESEIIPAEICYQRWPSIVKAFRDQYSLHKKLKNLVK